MRCSRRRGIVAFSFAVTALALAACAGNGAGQYGGGPTVTSAAQSPTNIPATAGAVGSAAGPVAPGEKPAPPPAPGTAITSNATAFFVTIDGYAVTNDHVVRRRRRLFALVGGKELPVQVVHRDEHHDLALIKIEIASRPIPIAATPPLKGEDVTALGYPVAGTLGTELKATFGRVNALSGLQNDKTMLQIDTPLQPGNSGGPVLNNRGEVVGVVTATFSTTRNVRMTDGALPQNVNYAVKSEYLVPLLAHNIAGKWRRGGGARFGSAADLVRQREASVVLLILR